MIRTDRPTDREAGGRRRLGCWRIAHVRSPRLLQQPTDDHYSLKAVGNLAFGRTKKTCWPACCVIGVSVFVGLRTSALRRLAIELMRFSILITTACRWRCSLARAATDAACWARTHAGYNGLLPQSRTGFSSHTSAIDVCLRAAGAFASVAAARAQKPRVNSIWVARLRRTNHCTADNRQ